MQMEWKLIVGIDPGWKSFGVSGVEGDDVIIKSYVPSSYPTYSFFLNEVWKDIGSPDCSTGTLYIERFVSYSNVMSDASEDILMMIGATKLFFETKGFDIRMVRAIEWKSKLCKWMFRNLKFNNPSSSFDKKYSIAAAKALLKAFCKDGIKIKSDHEADAICLSFLNKAL